MSTRAKSVNNQSKFIKRAEITDIRQLFDTGTNTSVRRIFERGPGNLRIMKNKRKISPLRISLFSCQKLGEYQKEKKKRRRSSLKFSPVFGPKLGGDQKKKKKRSSLRFCPLVCSNFLPELQRRGAMPEFCVLFYANYTTPATQRYCNIKGIHGTMPPLNTLLGTNLSENQRTPMQQEPESQQLSPNCSKDNGRVFYGKWSSFIFPNA